MVQWDEVWPCFVPTNGVYMSYQELVNNDDTRGLQTTLGDIFGGWGDITSSQNQMPYLMKHLTAKLEHFYFPFMVYLLHVLDRP